MSRNLERCFASRTMANGNILLDESRLLSKDLQEECFQILK